MPESFEQQPRESAKAFAAFTLYLNAGPERSIEAVSQKLSKSVPLLKRWSRRYAWADRVAARATHLATIEREAIEGLAVEKGVEWTRLNETIRIAEWQRHKRLIALADEMIRRWEKNPNKCGTLEGIARILELASKLGRLAAGMPTEVKEVNTTVTATVDVEWQIAIRKAYQVAGPAAVVPGPMGGNGAIEAEVVPEVKG